MPIYIIFENRSLLLFKRMMPFFKMTPAHCKREISSIIKICKEKKANKNKIVPPPEMANVLT